MTTTAWVGSQQNLVTRQSPFARSQPRLSSQSSRTDNSHSTGLRKTSWKWLETKRKFSICPLKTNHKCLMSQKSEETEIVSSDVSVLILLELKLTTRSCGKRLWTTWKNTMKIFQKITCRNPKCGKTGFGPLIWKYRLLLTSCKPTSIRTLKYPIKTQHWRVSSFLQAAAATMNNQTIYSAIYLDHSTENHYDCVQSMTSIEHTCRWRESQLTRRKAAIRKVSP